MVLARARLASTLLALCWAAAALSGCLLSQEDRILTDPRNRPPRVMEELLDPRDRWRTVLDCSIPLEFSFSAEDPDVNDLLKVRWYVDYNRTQLFNPDDEQRLAVNGQTRRDDQGSLTIRLDSPALPLPYSQLQGGVGTHVVEAVLYDFLLGPGRTPVPMTPGTDGGIPNPSYAVSYAWVVDVRRTCP